jgi:ferredoxin-NADP reductase
MVYENVNIPLEVKAVTGETPGYSSVYFERPQNFTFHAGDWMELDFPGKQLTGGVVYSFSSSPSEAELRITFRDGVSPFKKAIQSLKPGNKLSMTEYGNDYGFQLKEHTSNTLIAGGVGVAPFRSMLKEMIETGSKNQVQLIYFNTADSFLFADEFTAWQQQLPDLQIHCITTKDLNRKDREKLLKILIPDVNRQFYVSGPSGMVASTIELLERFGAERKKIKVDDFGHY